MKKWSSFFGILGIVAILLSVVCVIFSLTLCICVLLFSLFFFFLSSVCDAVLEHFANQKEIIRNQQKLIIMLDNMQE